MAKGYLLDTNTIIDFSSQKLPDNSQLQLAAIIDDSPYISVINKIELLGFTTAPLQIIEFVQQANIISLEDDIVIKTIEIRKKHRIKLPDAVIAATAVVYKLILITHNIVDFQNIKGLKVIDSHQDGLRII